MLFGADTNRNGILEAGEDAVARQSELPVTIGRGWSAYLTVHSAERNVRPDGTPKIDINSTDLNALHTELSGILDSEKANFIIAYRQGGPYEGEEEGNSAGSITVDFEQEGGTTIGSLLDLVGVKTQIPAENGGQGGQGGGQGGQGGGQGGQGGGQGGGGGAQPEVIAAAFPDDANSMQDYMPKLYDNLTVGTDPAVPGRVNINQAPRVVLQGLPGIEPLLVEQIISRRTPEKSPSMPAHNHPTWLVIEGLVELDEMKRLAPLLTCGGSVYRAECVGFYEAEGPAARLEVVLDGTKPVPAVRLRRDISELGPGQTLEILGGEVLAGEVESEP
jgi:DNA uptake protein ComE-like DNA-binding protein